MKLTDHFNSIEFTCKCGKCKESDPEYLPKIIHPELLDKIEELRLAIKLPINITSGVRCKEHHIEEYKAIYPYNWEQMITKHSFHLVQDDGYFKAVDIKVDFTGNDMPKDYYTLAIYGGYFRFKGIIIYLYSNIPSFLHLDTGNRVFFGVTKR